MLLLAKVSIILSFLCNVVKQSAHLSMLFAIFMNYYSFIMLFSMPFAHALNASKTMFFHVCMNFDTAYICFRLHSAVPLHQRKGRRRDNAGNHTSLTSCIAHLNKYYKKTNTQV